MDLNISEEMYAKAIIVNGQVEFEKKWPVFWKVLGHIFFLFCRAETFIEREYWRKFKLPKMEPKWRKFFEDDVRKQPVARILYTASNYVTFLKQNAMHWTAIEALYNENDWLKKEKTLWGRLITKVLSKVENIIATRNRLRNTKRIMFWEIVAQLNNGFEEVRIVSLASGPARSSIEVVAAILEENPELLDKFKIWLVDVDPVAFDVATQLAKEKFPGLEEKFEFKKTSISGSEKGIFALNEFLAGIKPTIVEMVGFGDYLQLDKAIAVNRAIYENLVPGGLLITNNVKPNDERCFLETIVTWTMINREESEVNEILAKAGFVIRTILNEPCDIQPVYLGRKL